jgi:energy-coupling factor transporter ATP-binding protein EcfA2
MVERLAELYSVKARFHRSARLDADLGDKNFYENFILHGTAWSVLERIALQFGQGQQKAFTVTGPYGGGKSSFAILLAGLLYPEEAARKSAEKVLSKDQLKTVRQYLKDGEKGWVVVRVVGAQGSPVQSLCRALKTAVAEYWPRRKPDSIANLPDICSEADLLTNIMAVADESNKRGGGLLIIMDEMGKVLEQVASENGDMYFFQNLAEQMTRSAAPALFIGILHQAFQEYAKNLGSSVQEEWAKVQGRFVDIPYAVSVDEVVGLVGAAIDGPTPDKDVIAQAKAVVNALPVGRFSTIQNLSQTLTECWPLNPLAALMLGPISRRRFGQNERSTFGLLTSMEPYGFKNFTVSHSSTDNYAVSDLWDYLRENLEPVIMVSPDAHKWAEATEAVDRVGRKSNNPLHSKIAKTIALLDMFGRQYGLQPTQALLEASFSDVPTSQITHVLEELQHWSVAVFRKHIEAWAIFAGSDIDVEGELQNIKAQMAESDVSWKQYLPALRPVVAKKNYHKTGALRWFDRVIEQEHLLHNQNEDDAPTEAIGRFVLVVGEKDITKQTQAAKKLSNMGSKDNFPILFGVSQYATAIKSAVFELACLEEVRRNVPGFDGDNVARRELAARLDLAVNRLAGLVEKAFEEATWFYAGKEISDNRNLSQIASDIAENVFRDSPTIKNELINRDKISSNAAAARRTLMYSMVDKANSERLGIEGYPPELSIYLSVIQASGLHVEEDGSYLFAQPTSLNFQKLWDRADELFQKDGSTHPLSLDRLYRLWKEQPFGVKSGVLPILALGYLLSREEELALYYDGLYTPEIDDIFVDRLLQGEADVAVRWFEIKGIRKSTLLKLAEFVQTQFDQKSNESALQIAKPLAKFMHSLKPWVKRTKRLSPQTIQIRDMVLKANDPYKLLFDDLPPVCGGKDAAGDEVMVKSLNTATNELRTAYDNLMAELKEAIFQHLSIEGSPEQKLEKAKKRAAAVINISGDFSLDAFARRLQQADGKNHWIESIASLAASKPPREWTDSDIDHAKAEMFELCSRFKRIEVYALTKAKQPGAYSVAMFMGDANEMHEYSSALQLTSDQKNRKHALHHQLSKMLQSSDAEKEVCLAALADLVRDLMGAEAQKKIRNVS